MVRLSVRGAALLDRWIAGDIEPSTSKEGELQDRLIRAGLVHPVPGECVASPSMAFVVPVYNDPAGLDASLRVLRREHPAELIMVVDDASPESEAIAEIADRHGARLVRHAVNRGPGAARNTGWRKCTSRVDGQLAPEVIVFVDADIVPQPDAVRATVAHFMDNDVAVAAPRVRSEAGTGWLAAYEQHNSPLDMGADAAIVFPGSRVSYVPSAMLAVRSEVLAAAGGFDEAMRYGEDVDLVWRTIHDGHLVRFEPRALAVHRNRASLTAFAEQRFRYGSSAATLAARHGDAVAPLQLPALTALSTLAMLLGGRLARRVGLAMAAIGVVPLIRKLDGKVDEKYREAVRLVLITHGYAAQGLATAATRSWTPLLLLRYRTRRALALALVVPAVIDWIRHRPANDPVTHTAVRAVDHGAYCAGVWSGVVRSRSIAALLPRIRFRTRPETR